MHRNSKMNTQRTPLQGREGGAERGKKEKEGNVQMSAYSTPPGLTVSSSQCYIIIMLCRRETQACPHSMCRTEVHHAVQHHFIIIKDDNHNSMAWFSIPIKIFCVVSKMYFPQFVLMCFGWIWTHLSPNHCFWFALRSLFQSLCFSISLTYRTNQVPKAKCPTVCHVCLQPS